ncbi:hypothetical protein BS50DRAFT_627824 [Corynespora cassiicola Philippines]|uniref:RING-type domain-containing protein n=1 Tax=Corynespora cassiicola Philippines TaxID=1448308 RepID=A0A2T2PA26_CORCC|nr:hypothetical protein BS50DRAFT_627824 [Corynespora cassiicola Philippines]
MPCESQSKVQLVHGGERDHAVPSRRVPAALLPRLGLERRLVKRPALTLTSIFAIAFHHHPSAPPSLHDPAVLSTYDFFQLGSLHLSTALQPTESSPPPTLPMATPTQRLQEPPRPAGATLDTRVEISTFIISNIPRIYDVEQLDSVTASLQARARPLPIPHFWQSSAGIISNNTTLPWSLFQEATAQTLFYEESNGYSSPLLSRFPSPPPGFPIFSINDARSMSISIMEEVKEFGNALFHDESPENHTIIMENSGMGNVHLPIHIWIQRIHSTREIDKPMFFFLRESLHVHTPYHILIRWDNLRCSKKESGDCTEQLVRQAEKRPRHAWAPLVLELYFLLLAYVFITFFWNFGNKKIDKITPYSHNEALSESMEHVPPFEGCLDTNVSALITAVRIKLYLWRMTRSHSMCGIATYRRQMKRQGFLQLIGEIYMLVAQEFGRLEHQIFGVLERTERAFVGNSIHVKEITRALEGDGMSFCSICQDKHLLPELVQPLSCQCVFGQECLEPLLNQDWVFSNACPNCRRQLHEPHEWRPARSRPVRDIRVGLLWALRSNILSLIREVMVSPEEFTRVERMTSWLRSMLQ